MSQLMRAMRRLWARQGIRFLAIGGLCAALTWGIRFALSVLMPFAAAVIASSALGMSAGFGLYRRYVFPHSGRPLVHQGALFIGVNLLSAAIVFVLAMAFMMALSAVPWPLAVQEGLAHALAIGCGAVINFLAHKSLTFSRSPDN